MDGCFSLTGGLAKGASVVPTQGEIMDEKKEKEDAANTKKGTVGSTLGGAVAGAVAGTALGVPVVGTVIGALSGAAIGGGKRTKKTPKTKGEAGSGSAKKEDFQKERVQDKEVVVQKSKT